MKITQRIVKFEFKSKIFLRIFITNLQRHIQSFIDE